MISISKRYTLFLVLFLLFSSIVLSNENNVSTITCCFTPGGNYTQEIVDLIHQTKKTLWIQAYQFTSQPIADAVIAAKHRGVDVRVILDKTQYTQKPRMRQLLF